MKDTERKLATILATDCVSFSKHMEDSEEKTLRNLNAVSYTHLTLPTKRIV